MSENRGSDTYDGRHLLIGIDTGRSWKYDLFIYDSAGNIKKNEDYHDPVIKI